MFVAASRPAAAWPTAPLRGGTVALAEALGSRPLDDALLLDEVIRRLDMPAPLGESARARIERHLARVAAAPAEPDAVPLPLGLAFWTKRVFDGRVAPDDVTLAILRDRRAGFLYHALVSMQPPTLAFFERHPDLLLSFRDRYAGALALVAGCLRIDGNAVVVPGGALGRGTWERMLGETATNAPAFLTALLAQDQGRVAYLFDAYSRWSPGHVRHALGGPATKVDPRAAQLRALAAVFARVAPEWRVVQQPFLRPRYDPGHLFTELAVTGEGRPALPLPRRFWDVALADDPGWDPPEPEAFARSEAADGAWLLARVLFAPTGRPDHPFAPVSLAQRLAAAGAPLPSVALAVRAARRFPMLALSLDRAGVTDAGVYVALARQAAGVQEAAPEVRTAALAQFQGALALVVQALVSGAASETEGQRLLMGLASVPHERGRFLGALTEWLQQTFAPAICGPAAGEECGPERAALLSWAGSLVRDGAPIVTWDGEAHVVSAAEGRLRGAQRVRAEQSGYRLDTIAACVAIVRPLLADGVNTAAIRSSRAQLVEWAERVGASTVAVEGLDLPALGAAALGTARDLGTAGPGDARRAAIRLLGVADALAADTLRALVYAGPVAATRDPLLAMASVPRHHVFAVGARPHEPWLLARPMSGPLVPWHLVGSLLALDFAMAPQTMRPAAPDAVPSPVPVDEASVTALAQDALVLRARPASAGEEAMSLLEWLRRGRAVVASVVDPGGADDLARRLGLSASRREAIRWRLERDHALPPAVFSRTELARLGHDDGAWPAVAQASALPLDGTLRARPPLEGGLEQLVGAPSSGAAATQVLDLHIRTLEFFAARQLPPALLPAMLPSVAYTVVTRAQTTSPDDWQALVRAIAAIGDEDLDEVVSSLTFEGPLVPVENGEDLDR